MTQNLVLDFLRGQWDEWSDLWRSPEQAELPEPRPSGQAPHRSYQDLIRLRTAIEALRVAVSKQERRLGWLQEHVQTYLKAGDQATAWRYALELEQTQAALEKDRSRMAEHEAAYRNRLREVNLRPS